LLRTPPNRRSRHPKTSRFTLAATSQIGLATLQKPENVPWPQMLLGRYALGQVGVYWMLLATLFTGVMTFNGGFATASRFLYAAAREATLPAIFARLNGRLVPYTNVIALALGSAAIAVIVYATDGAPILILVGAVLEGLIYAVAGLCVIQLRRRQKTADRPFRIPLGWTVPILAILVFGALGLLAGVTSDPPVVPLAIVVVLFFASYLYVKTVVPRLKAKEEARRAALGSRRPRRPQPAAAPVPAPAADAAPTPSPAPAPGAGEG